MNDSFNLIGQSRYYLKRFTSLLDSFERINYNEQEYALSELHY